MGRDRRIGTLGGVIGSTNTGKTTTLRALINVNKNRKFLVYGAGDASGQWIQGEWKGNQFFHKPGSLNIAECTIVKTYEQQKAALEKSRVVIFEGIDDINAWCKYCVENLSRCTLVIDEIDNCHEIRRTVREVPPHWNRLWSKHRHIGDGEGMSLLWACQKMSKVHQDLIDECKWLFIHALPSTRQLERLKDFFQIDWNPQVLRNQEKGHCFVTFLGLYLEKITRQEQYILKDLTPW